MLAGGRVFETSPQVKEVLYTGKGGMVSFKIQDEKKIPNLLNSLQVFTFAESLGGVESLITYPNNSDSCGHSCRSSPFIRFDR